jgi:hypothetical protein
MVMVQELLQMGSFYFKGLEYCRRVTKVSKSSLHITGKFFGV